MNKGTIYYVGGFELPDKNAAAHRVVANGRIMRELGFDVVYIGVDKSRSGTTELLRNDTLGFECWSVPYPSGGMRNWLKYILGLSSILNLIQKARPINPTGVICYNYPAVAQLRIQLLCRGMGIKNMSDTTEWYDANGGKIIYRIVKFIDTSIRMYFVNRLADGIITTSKYLTDFYSRLRKPIVELPTLYDTVNFEPPCTKDFHRKQFIYVGSPFDVGRVNKKRTNLKERLDVCIELFYRLKKERNDFSFEIYGITADDYLHVFPEHAEMIKEMQSCVFFKGSQPHALVLQRIAESDFSIFFRDQTRVTLAGFPSKLAESISCGTPVVSNKMVSIEKYSQIDGLFLTNRGEEYSLLQKVMAFSRDEINVLKLRTYQSRTFDYRSYVAMVAEFLSEI